MMRGLLLVPLGLIVLQITTITANGASSSRLVEKEIDVHLAADNKHLESGLGKPLRLSGYFKVTNKLSSLSVHNTHDSLPVGAIEQRRKKREVNE